MNLSHNIYAAYSGDFVKLPSGSVFTGYRVNLPVFSGFIKGQFSGFSRFLQVQQNYREMGGFKCPLSGKIGNYREIP